MTTLTWHGHSNFQIATPNVNILIDPFFEGNPTAATPWTDIPKPDIILVTHDHGDHVGQTVEIAQRTGALVGAIVGTAGKLQAAGVPAAQILNGIGFNIGGTIETKGVRITMTQAFHSSESGSPAGYILTLENGQVIYHAGDTGIFGSMKQWGQLHDIDVALLPIGSTFTMDPRQAALACKLLDCKRCVPMHWGTFPVLEANTASFKAALAQFAPGVEVVDMEPGQSVEL